MYAARVTVNDDIISDVRELSPRFVGPNPPEVRKFESDVPALTWIKKVHVKNRDGSVEGQFYEIRGGDLNVVVINIVDVGGRLTGGSVFDVFISESDVHA